jgi:protein-tyrosine phosphatase
MDDGSKSVEESLVLLKMLSDQRADTIVATPHFYANRESVAEFIDRREKAYQRLQARVPEQYADILLGAEVRYYHGIGRMAQLDRLCIGDSRLLLLEMPMEKWTDYTVRELMDLANTGNVRLMLAHIERYYSLQSKDAWNRLYDTDIQMQVNAGFFTGIWTKRKALSFLEDGRVHLIGSDCHNIEHRPPRLGKAYENIEKKFGKEFAAQFIEYGRHLLE